MVETLTTFVKIVSGTCRPGDTHATEGSVAKAINDAISGIATTVEAISIYPLGWGKEPEAGTQYAVAVIVYT